MKVGNVSQTVLRRSILKQLHTRREESIIQPSVEEMCAAIRIEEDEQVVFTNTSLFGDEKDLAVFAMAHVLNDLWTRGAEPIGVNISILLPPHAYESRLKSMISYAEEVAARQKIQILNAKAEVSPVLSKSLVTVFGIGKEKKEGLLQSSMGMAGQDVVLTNWIGLEGMLRILREKKEELSKRFVPAFLHQIEEQQQYLLAGDELRIAKEFGVSAMHQITEGGILAALWNLTEASGTGIDVDLKKIAIKQETIEVCEHFHLNPYQMTSAGSILLVTHDGEGLVSRLEKNGKKATVIGRLTDRNEKVIWNDTEKRFIDRPAQDELLKIYTGEITAS
mgnify:FL=1